MLTVLIALVIGYIIGLLQHGIRINVKTDRELPTEYNDPIIDNIDPEIRNYLDQTNGQIKF